MQETVKYSDPVLRDYSGDLNKKWFVYFDVKNLQTGQLIQKQIRAGINDQITVAGRRKAAKMVIEHWLKKLREGYNPFAPIQTETNIIASMNFKQALEFALKECKKTTAADTYKGYRLCVKYIKSVAQEFEHMPVTAIEKIHIKLILAKAHEEYKWSNARYNRNYEYLRAVMGRLKEWEIIKYNPCSEIKLMPTVETKKFIPYTPKEKKKIADHLFIHHYNFFVYLMMIYHAGIRPKEILALKIKDVDLAGAIISIYPDLAEENSKTKGIRYIPVNKELMPFLRELKLEQHNKEAYIFGSPYESGRGNKGSAKGKLSGAMHPDYFKPSFTRIKRDTVTKLWQKIVKTKLGIDKYLYAAKHTGGDDKLLAGIPVDALKELYGHTSKFMTEKYLSQLLQIHRNSIINQSPAFN